MFVFTPTSHTMGLDVSDFRMNTSEPITLIPTELQAMTIFSLRGIQKT